MHIVLFITYGIVLAYLLTRLPMLRSGSLRPVAVLAYFIIHVATGCLHNWVAWHYYPGHGDIWRFFTNSFTTRQELKAGFSVFWADNSGLADLPHNLIEWMHVIFNVFSFDNLYINTLFFIFFTLGGSLALFEVCYRRLNKDLFGAGVVLLLPSTLFWTACMHTEALVYCLLGWLIWHMDKLFRRTQTTVAVPHPQSSASLPPSQPQPPAHRTNPTAAPPGTPHIQPAPSQQRKAAAIPYGRIALCILLAAVATFLRPALGIGLIPALGIWILAEQGLSTRQWLSLGAGALALLTLTALAAPSVFSPLLRTLAARQTEFQNLTGASRIFLPILHPNFQSFRELLPTAAFNGLFQPMPGTGGQAIYLAFSIELVIIWLMIACGSIRCFTASPLPATPKFTSSFAAFCLVLAIPSMILVGYIVPFVGTIIRYRSIYLPFLLLPFLPQLRCPTMSRINGWLRHLLAKD